MQEPEVTAQLSAPEMERAVLGATLLSSGVMLQVSEIVRSEMFHDYRHRVIYEAIHTLWMAGKPIDMLMVVQHLKADGKLKEAGGVHYISTLTNDVASSANCEFHARIIVQYHVARELEKIAISTSLGVYRTRDHLDLLDITSAKITDLYSLTTPIHSATAADNITDITDAEAAKYYTYGIHDLDRVAVFEAGLPHVFAGRPGIGKSIFCIEVCWHLTLTGPVLLFSPEMTLRQVQARILSRETGVSYRSILRKQMDEPELKAVIQATGDLYERLKRLKVDPSGGITPDQIRVRTERAMKSEGIIAFAVDHLHKMKTGDKRVDRSDYERISQCMNGLTEVAKNTMLPALVMCQLNREVEKRSDKRPNMADLRGSGEIEQDAAVIGLLYRAGYYEPEPPFTDTIEINIAKNRDGAVGVATSEMTPAMSRIGPSGYISSPREFAKPQEQLTPPF